MPAPQPFNPALVIFSDFDGTITQCDVTDTILGELASPMWREVEDEWVRGLIGSRECLQRQMALISTSRRQLNALIDSVSLDPAFQNFYAYTRRRGIPFYVVSDGFDYVIRRILKRAGVDGELRNGCHLFASSLAVNGNRLTASFTHSVEGCEHGCATCKPTVIRQVVKPGQTVVFIGDGLSDRFAVEVADIVFAKRHLLDYCRHHQIACRPFETFADIQATLGDLALRRETDSPRKDAKVQRANGVKPRSLAADGAR